MLIVKEKKKKQDISPSEQNHFVLKITLKMVSFVILIILIIK